MRGAGGVPVAVPSPSPGNAVPRIRCSTPLEVEPWHPGEGKAPAGALGLPGSGNVGRRAASSGPNAESVDATEEPSGVEGRPTGEQGGDGGGAGNGTSWFFAWGGGCLVPGSEEEFKGREG